MATQHHVLLRSATADLSQQHVTASVLLTMFHARPVAAGRWSATRLVTSSSESAPSPRSPPALRSSSPSSR